MGDLLQLIIEKYSSRDQLIQNGIWDSEIYSNNKNDLSNASLKEIVRKDRAWIWRSLLLHQENEKNNNGSSDDSVSFITSDNALSSSLDNLISVPIISKSSSATSPTVVSAIHGGIMHTVNPIKKFSSGIRKLTPRETHIHPLHHHDHTHEHDRVTPIERDDSMNLQETLEIIDLDLSRLMIDDIFQRTDIHACMRQIMFNYLVLSNKEQSIPIEKQKFHYKQGYHEILGLIFLQFYDASSPEMSTEQIKIVLFIFIKLMSPLVKHFYIEDNLISWESHKFRKMLKLCSPKLYSIFYPTNESNNMIWLIRWTRVLFLRELPQDHTLIIWDHILTFSYPLSTLVSSIIIAILLSLQDRILAIMNDDGDMDDLIEFMLRFGKDDQNGKVDVLDICKLTRSICDAWYCGNFNELSNICDNYVKCKNVDPNRTRLENKLRERVMKSLNK